MGSAQYAGIPIRRSGRFLTPLRPPLNTLMKFASLLYSSWRVIHGSYGY